MLRILLIFLLLSGSLMFPVYAENVSLKAKIKSMMHLNNPKPRPLQVKTIPAGSACTPDVPKNCDVKK